MLPPDRRAAFARHTQWLALAPAQPLWWLRLSDAAVNLAPVLLLAVMMLRLGDVLIDSNADEARTSRRCHHQLASRWAFLFALLVPLQLIGYAWLWADSDSQLNRQINQGERGVAELDSLLAAANPGPLPPLQGGSLAERKQQLSEAIAINTSRISSSLRDQRAETLRASLPGTLRVLFGAAIVSAFLFNLRRQI